MQVAPSFMCAEFAFSLKPADSSDVNGADGIVFLAVPTSRDAGRLNVPEILKTIAEDLTRYFPVHDIHLSFWADDDPVIWTGESLLPLSFWNSYDAHLSRKQSGSFQHRE